MINHRQKKTILIFFCLCIYGNQTKQLNLHKTQIKGTAVPLQAWSGPKGSRKLRFPDYMTTAQDGGKAVSLTHRPPDG